MSRRGIRRGIAAALFWAIIGGAWCVPGSAAAESVFDAGGFYGGVPEAFSGAGETASFGAAAGIVLAASQDTMETFAVELDEQDKGMSIYKEVALVAVVSGIVGYAVYEMIKADDDVESEDDGGSGKPTPFAAPRAARFAFIRSR